MRWALAGLAGVLITGSASASGYDRNLAAAAAGAGCPAPDASETTGRLDPAPAGLGAERVYASLTRDAAGETAALCIALLNREGDRYIRLASGSASVGPETSPSRFWPVIDLNGYPLGPDVVGLGVSASASLNTTSVSEDAISFVLFRRMGDRLVAVFDMRVVESSYDKVRDRGNSSTCQLELGDRSTGGLRDLAVICKGHRTRYAWSGERYEQVP